MKLESKIYLGKSEDILPTFKSDSFDLMPTDPPYGVNFMGKDWDKAVPPIALWKECLRVLKPGAFAFVMCIPRQDCLAHMIVNLGDAGFNVAFSSIYWTYANGFPKAQNLSKAADKRAGVEQEVIGSYQMPDGKKRNWTEHNPDNAVCFKNKILKYSKAGRPLTIPTTPQAKALEGAYGGFQPKPAVEIVIVAMKPIEEKTFLDQAIKNGHGCTWLDNCKIPYENESDSTLRPNGKSSYVRGGGLVTFGKQGTHKLKSEYSGGDEKGRFPANLVCEDDVLNNGALTKSQGSTGLRSETATFKGTEGRNHFHYDDEGSFSRYFSLDAWFAERVKLLPMEAQKTFPWLIVPKASKGEKNKYTKEDPTDNSDVYNGKFPDSKADKDNSNKHPTIKPLKLMSWLVTLGSSEGDMVLDPFLGSGTTYIAATGLGRFCKGIEMKKDYYDTAIERANLKQKNLSAYF